MKKLNAFIVLALALAISLPAFAKSMDEKRASLKEAVNKQIVAANKDLAKYREEVQKEGVNVKVSEKEALTKVETDIAALEGKMARIDSATETEWKSVKAEVERSRKDLKYSLKQADEKID